MIRKIKGISKNSKNNFEENTNRIGKTNVYKSQLNSTAVKKTSQKILYLLKIYHVTCRNFYIEVCRTIKYDKNKHLFGNVEFFSSPKLSKLFLVQFPPTPKNFLISNPSSLLVLYPRTSVNVRQLTRVSPSSLPRVRFSL